MAESYHPRSRLVRELTAEELALVKQLAADSPPLLVDLGKDVDGGQMGLAGSGEADSER